jgi:hypothetical protein
MDICKTQSENEECIRVVKYEDGKWSDLFHAHIPRRRLNNDDKHSLLRALVIRHYPMNPDQIVRSYFNKACRNKPPRSTALDIHTETVLEAGILRRYCGQNVIALLDEVVGVDKFKAFKRQT